MLKFQDILDKLSIEQKIDIICNFPSIKDDGLINDCGVIRESSYNSGEYLAESPAFFALARSWNNALIKKVSERFFTGCKDKHGISLMDLPSASVKVSPYSTGLSEDPYLTGSLVKACIDAGKSSHVATCLINPVLDKDTSEYADKTLDSAVINDYLFKSYEYLKSNRPSVLKIDLHAGDSAFGEQNDKNVAEFSKNIPVLYSGVDSEYAFTEIFGKDKFILGLNRSKLQDACENYDTLTERYKSGEIELSDVILSCEGGTAVSPDMLDRVVNNILAFSEYCGGEIRKSGDDQSYIVKEKSKQEKEEWFATGVAAATESTVLLKNDGVLPLKKSQSFVLYGELADYAKFQDVTLKSFLEKYAGKNFAGYAMGYSGKVLQKEKLVEAKSLFNKANIAVVAIGYNDEEAECARKNRNCRIPAPQEALINELYNSGKKVIAILYGDCSFDMSFDDKCAAVLLASGFNKFDDYAIHKILFGQLSPSGKLINTLYANTDEYFLNLKNYKDSGRNKMGSFYGYRRYDTAGYKVKYPFGHGLSYATFKYYGLKIANDQISFYIKNVSRLSGAEAVQIYVGVQKSAIIRPKKELKAFFKVNLSAGKKVRVTIPLSSLDLNTFYNEEGAFVKERGKYVVYVCSSASDERLKGSFVSGLKTLKPDGEKYSSYFQTVGNIKDGGYTLEETVKLSKISQKPMFGVSLGFLLAFMFVDLAYLYFADIGWIFDNTWIFIVLMAITAIPAIFAVIFKIKINREIGKSMLNSKKLKEDKRKSIAEEDLNDEINYVELFEEEFAAPVIEAADEDSEQEIQESKTETFDFDADITFARATDELFELCKAKGITIDRKSLRALFAGFASSRLIILKSDAKDLIAPFLETLSEYFGCGNSVIDCKPVQTEEQEVVKEDVVAKENEQPIEEIIEETKEDVAATDSEAVEEPSEEPVAESEETEQAIEEPVVEEERQVEDISESEIKEEKRSVSENVAINIYNGSQSHENDVNVLSLTNIGAEEIQTVMTRFLRYFDRPDCTVKIDVPEEYGETSIKVPENFWFIVTLAEGQKVSELPKNILETASVAELSAKAARSASDNEEASFAHISYYQFTTMAERAARAYSIDENSWKRLDNFESKINAKDDSFHISNKQWQHFEKHAAVYLATGGEQTEALDNIMSSHVVYLTIPILANARANEKLSYVLEESFGEGNVPQCLQAIKTDSIK